VTAASFLPVYLERLDAGGEIVTMLTRDFTFSLLWGADGAASEFAGGLDEFYGYLDQRDPAGQLHHISRTLREGNIEIASGWTTRHGNPLGTFLLAVELDGERARRLFATRTEGFAGVPF
jgi:hypothetical protein